MRELWEQSCSRREDQPGVGVTHMHAAPLTHWHSPKGLSMEGRFWLGGYQQPQVWHVMSQVHPGNPTRRHNYRGGPRLIQRQVLVHQSPARASVGLPGGGRGGSHVRTIRGIKAC